LLFPAVRVSGCAAEPLAGSARLCGLLDLRPGLWRTSPVPDHPRGGCGVQHCGVRGAALRVCGAGSGMLHGRSSLRRTHRHRFFNLVFRWSDFRLIADRRFGGVELLHRVRWPEAGEGTSPRLVAAAADFCASLQQLCFKSRLTHCKYSARDSEAHYYYFAGSRPKKALFSAHSRWSPLGKLPTENLGCSIERHILGQTSSVRPVLSAAPCF